MRDSPPDLVVSGINAGPNLGADWIFSGTLGAARVAAIAGVHAMAVSGPTHDPPGAADSTADWVVRLAHSDLLRELPPHGYLTVAFPIVPPGGVRGFVAVDRAPLRLVPHFEPNDDGSWRVAGEGAIGMPTPNDSDEAGWRAGYIVVTPMRANEVDADLLHRWQRQNLSNRVKKP
jgi:5'-nucleotidase